MTDAAEGQLLQSIYAAIHNFVAQDGDGRCLGAVLRLNGEDRIALAHAVAVAAGPPAEVRALVGNDPLIGANGQRVERMTINGCEQEVDAEIASIVRALNIAGIRTVASCSGHGVRLGNVALADGRELIVVNDYTTARRIEKEHPSLGARSLQPKGPSDE